MSKGSRQQQVSRVEAEVTASPDEMATTVGARTAKAIAPRAAQQLSTPDVEDEEGSGPPSEEDEFFARGDSSFPPSAIDTEHLETESELPPPPSPEVLQRRARLRRVVGAVVGVAALWTGVVGAKALVGHPDRVTVSDGSLSVPNRVVPSIAIGTAPEPAPAAAAASPQAAENSGADEPGANTAAAAAVEPGENSAAAPAEEKQSGESAQGSAQAASAPTVRRLPIIDVEIPTAPDPATDEQWQSAARNLSSQDFKAADKAFAELGKRPDAATREAARLARAVWWTANGKQSEVKPVLADLAENATTPSVKQHARELLRTN